MNANMREFSNSVAASASKGILASEISSAHQALNLYGRSKSLSQKEVHTLKRLMELHAYREEWDRVVDIASRGIVVGLPPTDEITMYRIWVEGLKEDFDVEGLTELGRHLVARRDENAEYLAVGVLAFVYAGKVNAVKAGIGHLYRMDATSPVVEEVLAIVKCEAAHREERMMGLRDLAHALKDSDCGYLAYRRFLEYALENNALATASATIKSLNKRFPESPDAYMISALLDINAGEWNSAMDALRVVIAHNPSHTEAILMMARCLEMTGRVSDARFYLLQQAPLFAQGDYEFHIQLGMLEKRLSEGEKTNDMLTSSAAAHLKVALQASRVYGFPAAPIQSALVDLGAVAKSAEAPRQRYWLLNLDAKPLAELLEMQDFQLRCPRDVQMGDVVFFAAKGRSANPVHAVSGFFKVHSKPMVDAKLGLTVLTKNAVVFEHDVTISRENGVFPTPDAHGLENFSEKHFARFFELDSSVADHIVTEVENMHVHMARAV
jgi:tetratricopeptide (TPR) repeat protein